MAHGKAKAEAQIPDNIPDHWRARRPPDPSVSCLRQCESRDIYIEAGDLRKAHDIVPGFTVDDPCIPEEERWPQKWEENASAS